MPLGPEEVKNKDPEVEKYFQEIDNQLKDHSENHYKDYTFAILLEEICLEKRMVISKIYLKAGWSKVQTTISSENGERPGLTEFRMYY